MCVVCEKCNMYIWKYDRFAVAHLAEMSVTRNRFGKEIKFNSEL